MWTSWWQSSKRSLGTSSMGREFGLGFGFGFDFCFGFGFAFGFAFGFCFCFCFCFGLRRWRCGQRALPMRDMSRSVLWGFWSSGVNGGHTRSSSSSCCGVVAAVCRLDLRRADRGSSVPMLSLSCQIIVVTLCVILLLVSSAPLAGGSSSPSRLSLRPIRRPGTGCRYPEAQSRPWSLQGRVQNQLHHRGRDKRWFCKRGGEKAEKKIA